MFVFFLSLMLQVVAYNQTELCGVYFCRDAKWIAIYYIKFIEKEKYREIEGKKHLVLVTDVVEPSERNPKSKFVAFVFFFVLVGKVYIW